MFSLLGRLQNRLHEVERTCSRTLKIHVTRIVWQLLKDEARKISPRLRDESSEERGEDPAIVTIYAVVVNHRTTLAVDAYANERPTRVIIAT